jgi:hypothetical protein
VLQPSVVLGVYAGSVTRHVRVRVILNVGSSPALLSFETWLAAPTAARRIPSGPSSVTPAGLGAGCDPPEHGRGTQGRHRRVRGCRGVDVAGGEARAGDGAKSARPLLRGHERNRRAARRHGREADRSLGRAAPPRHSRGRVRSGIGTSARVRGPLAPSPESHGGERSCRSRGLFVVSGYGRQTAERSTRSGSRTPLNLRAHALRHLPAPAHLPRNRFPRQRFVTSGSQKSSRLSGA